MKDVKVYIHTNLDVKEDWPKTLPIKPNIGEFIWSNTKHRNYARLKLKIVAIEHYYNNDGEYIMDIELHDYLDRSITEFHKWYRRLK